MTTELASALESAGVQLKKSGEDWTARVRAGLRERTAALALDAREAELSDDADERRRQLASYARGAYLVLSEPGRSDAADMTFASAASGLLPTVEGPWFAQGVLDAGGEEADVYPFGDGLVVAHLIELDEGYRVVTAPQRARWGATADRVQKAAASILFHRTSFACFEPIDGDTEAIAMRDGFDAARCLILDLWDWERTRKGCLFALPSPDRMIVCNATDPSARAHLAELARREFTAASEPLTPRVFAFAGGKREASPVA